MAIDVDLEKRVLDLEAQLRDLDDALASLRGDGGMAGPFNGDIDMAGNRVTNAEQSSDSLDYVTRGELNVTVSGSGVAFQSEAGSGTGYSLTVPCLTSGSVIGFANGALMHQGASGNMGYTIAADLQTITTNRSFASSTQLLWIYIPEVTL